jgi:hypothetical protein
MRVCMWVCINFIWFTTATTTTTQNNFDVVFLVPVLSSLLSLSSLWSHVTKNKNTIEIQSKLRRFKNRNCYTHFFFTFYSFPLFFSFWKKNNRPPNITARNFSWSKSIQAVYIQTYPNIFILNIVPSTNNIKYIYMYIHTNIQQSNKQ